MCVCETSQRRSPRHRSQTTVRTAPKATGRTAIRVTIIRTTAHAMIKVTAHTMPQVATKTRTPSPPPHSKRCSPKMHHATMHRANSHHQHLQDQRRSSPTRPLHDAPRSTSKINADRTTSIATMHRANSHHQQLQDQPTPRCTAPPRSLQKPSQRRSNRSHSSRRSPDNCCTR
jgi:hypothetical protein